MHNTLTFVYLGYTGVADWEPDEGSYHGIVRMARDLVTFESDTAEGAEKEFQTSLDVYLELCAGRGMEPSPPA